MPRGRPKGSKNKVSMNLNLPVGGTRFLNTKKRIAAKTAAYAAFSPAQMSGRNTMAALFPYGTASSFYKGKKIRQPRKSKSPTTSAAAVVKAVKSVAAVKSAVKAVVSAAAKVKKAASPTQLANLAKAREARAASRGLYAVLPKGGTRALNTVARRQAKALAYAGMSAAMLSGGNTMPAVSVYGNAPTDRIGRFIVSR
jgi:hypothetical protein